MKVKMGHEDDVTGGLIRVAPSALRRGYLRRRKGARKAGLERSIADVRAMLDRMAQQGDPWDATAQELRGASVSLAWRACELYGGGRDALFAVERAMSAEPMVADLLVEELLGTLEDVRAESYAASAVGGAA